MHQATRAVHHDLGRGFWTLRAISETAMLLGGFQFCLGIINAHRGFSGGNMTIYVAVVTGLGEAVAILLPWMALALLSQVLHRRLDACRRQLIGECGVTCV